MEKVENMSDKNKHGLSRYIPEDVKRKVRQKCGYGCVVCGTAIVEYEHVDPEFSEAKEHDPDKIVLLCSQCHAKVTRKFLSKESIKLASKKPASIKSNYASEMFQLLASTPKFVIGGASITNTPIPLEVKGYPVIQVKPAEEDGAPARFSATFFNSRGELSLQIIDNEWRVNSGNWDFEAVGGTLIVRDNQRNVSLKLRVSDSDGIIVEKINMRIDRYRIEGSKTELFIRGDDGTNISCGGMIMNNCGVGFSLN
ncbi:HNH endonuclease [Vibrio parahaemolyticus]|nr:HNH endonuclease [Vibrio parahaemolyticus]EGR2899848.1 HNH endonuclease [Vibrio parahaemolyticus]EGR2904607.1 HNH endonuclease [Vibrio parahaemolyticus]EGR3087292.1 HNH endonuclease [Vibrio parahaemolyticus]TOD59725.1 HNH endonuclease [Vibrio parahaemolyticus]